MRRNLAGACVKSSMEQREQKRGDRHRVVKQVRGDGEAWWMVAFSSGRTGIPRTSPRAWGARCGVGARRGGRNRYTRGENRCKLRRYVRIYEEFRRVNLRRITGSIMNEVDRITTQKIRRECAREGVGIDKVSRAGTVLVLRASAEIGLPEADILQKLCERVKGLLPDVRYVTLDLGEVHEE